MSIQATGSFHQSIKGDNGDVVVEVYATEGEVTSIRIGSIGCSGWVIDHDNTLKALVDLRDLIDLILIESRKMGIEKGN